MSAVPLWTASDLATACGGKTTGDWSINGVSIDTRTLAPGDLFVALEGDNRDGHLFVEAAFENQAAAALVTSAHDFPDRNLLIVEDTLRALNDIGRASRDRTGAKTVAVTGSAGKTSTKEILRRILGQFGNAHASVASYNNHWGVPLTLARMPANTDYGVFEIGMNHPGEIAPLAKLVRPHVAIITTVQAVHLGFFETVDGIADEKADIFAGLLPGGVAIVDGDIPQLGRVVEKASSYGVTNVQTFGEAADAAARIVETTPFSHSTDVVADIEGHRVSYNVGLPGHHSVKNSLAVLLALKALGLDLEKVLPILATVAPPDGRGARHQVKWGDRHLELIDESYNANPASMRAALEVLSLSSPARGGRRIAVIGDMLELGVHSEKLHRELLKPIEESKVDLVFAVGEHMAALWDELPETVRGQHSKTSKDLVEQICTELRDGDIVMVKGSLGTKMKTIVDGVLALGQAERPTS